MTEQEWLECTDSSMMYWLLYRRSRSLPNRFVDWLSEYRRRPQAGRQELLASVAFCCRYWHLIACETRQRAVDEVEQAIETKDISEFRESAFWTCEAVGTVLGMLREGACKMTLYWSEAEAKMAHKQAAEADTFLCNVIREIFGNPFHPVSLDPTLLTWRNGTIPKLAQVIYDDRAFERLPALADALQEAGCHNAEILNHCRQPGVHTRGCWVLDLLLGKQ